MILDFQKQNFLNIFVFQLLAREMGSKRPYMLPSIEMYLERGSPSPMPGTVRGSIDHHPTEGVRFCPMCFEARLSIVVSVISDQLTHLLVIPHLPIQTHVSCVLGNLD